MTLIHDIDINLMDSVIVCALEELPYFFNLSFILESTIGLS